jgi:16S rRNA (guanine527-N7)-methyltransferase
LEWNSKINLTAIVDYRSVLIKHFLDSLSGIIILNERGLVNSNLKMIDIGTGAGFPGIPLKIILPQISLVLLEATIKKTTFLKYIINKMSLEKVEVIAARSEELAHNLLHREQYDVVVSRAVAPMCSLAELTLPFCRTGGILFAYKKGNIIEEMIAADRAITVLGGNNPQIKNIYVEGVLDERSIVVIEKGQITPLKFPRRSGIPNRKPIH